MHHQLVGKTFGKYASLNNFLSILSFYILFCVFQFKTYRQPKPENQKPSPPINYKELPQMYEHSSSSDLLCTIKIRNLCKTVDSEKSYELSLDNISLDIFEVYANSFKNVMRSRNHFIANVHICLLGRNFGSCWTCRGRKN